MVQKRIIHFRSRAHKRTLGETSYRYHRDESGEFDTLRPYSDHDDARRIAWKLSAKGDGIYIRETLSRQEIQIMLVGEQDDGWNFFSPQNSETKNDFFRSLDTSIVESLGTSLSTLYRKERVSSLKTLSEKLSHEKIKNTCIMIVTGNVDQKGFHYLKSISRLNDIIVIHLFHPYELYPDNSLLIESKKIQKTSYISVFSDALMSIKNFCLKNMISYIQCTSSDDPVMIMNFFFKNRYDR